MQEDFWNGRVIFFLSFQPLWCLQSPPCCSDAVQPGLHLAPQCFCVTDRTGQMHTWFPAELWLLLVWLLLCCALWRRDGGERQTGENKQARVSEAAFVLRRSKTFLHVLFTAAPPKEHLLSKANEVFVVSVDVGELDVYQQQNLQRTEISSISQRCRKQNGPWSS